MTEGARPPGAADADAQPTTPAPPDGVSPGATILGGKYRIEREVGQGAFGRVYLAFDPMLRRHVAIKELLAARNKGDGDTYARYLERFEREARAGGGMMHPNIVAVFELAVDADDNYYLVMEYVDGADLRALLDQVGTLPVARVVALAIEIASALDVVHDNDIVHRDLKPANIMLTRRGTAKVTDFGVAQVGNESHRTQIASGHPGTPMYMSPEQARGFGYIDGRSDLYSLGLILYEMLVGEPYARKRIPLAEKRPDLPTKLVAITDRLMAEEARDRYQSAEGLLTDLRQLSAAPAAPALPVEEAVGDVLAVEEGATRIGIPPPGVPSAYGGAASQSAPAVTPAPVVDQAEAATRLKPAESEGKTRIGPPVVPGGASHAGAPPVTGVGRFSPVAPPPGDRPVTSRRGLWIGLAGVLVVLIVGGSIAGLVVGRGASESFATYTPRPDVVTDTAKPVVRATPTLVPLPITTNTATPMDFSNWYTAELGGSTGATSIHRPANITSRSFRTISFKDSNPCRKSRTSRTSCSTSTHISEPGRLLGVTASSSGHNRREIMPKCSMRS